MTSRALELLPPVNGYEGWKGTVEPRHRGILVSIFFFAARIGRLLDRGRRRMRGEALLSISKNPPLSHVLSSWLLSFSPCSYEHLNLCSHQENHGTDEEERQGRVDARRGRSSTFFDVVDVGIKKRGEEKVKLLSFFSSSHWADSLFELRETLKYAHEIAQAKGIENE